MVWYFTPSLAYHTHAHKKFYLLLRIFFVLFFFFGSGGEVWNFFKSETFFTTQLVEGHHKVFSLQANQLLFFLPVIFIHSYFKINIVNAILVIGSVLMALLIARKSIVLLYAAYFIFLLGYSLYEKRNLNYILRVFAPVLISCLLFTLINPNNLTNITYS